MDAPHVRKNLLSGSIKTLIAVGLFIVVFLYLNSVFMSKFTEDTVAHPNIAATSGTKGFYALPHDSVDILFLGSSYVKYGVNPLIIWQNLHIGSQIFCTGEERVHTSLFFLEEALKTQKPKYVFFEATQLLNDSPYAEGTLRRDIGDVPLSIDKINYLRNTIGTNVLDYIFPLLRYHDRWKSLTFYDFTYPLKTNYHDPYRGYSPYFYQGKFTMKDYNTATTQVYTVSDNNRAYLQQMKDLCDKNGIELILFKVPTVNWIKAQADAVADAANQAGVTFVDFTLSFTDAGMNQATDFADTLHLNYSGAEKFTRDILCKFISKTLDVSKCTAISDARQWEMDYQYYQQAIKARRLVKTTNFLQYLDMLVDDHYTLFFAVQDEASRKMTGEYLTKMRALGLHKDIGGPDKYYRWAYIAITDGNKPVYEAHKKAWLEYRSTYGGNYIYLQSAGFEDGNSIAMTINGHEYATNATNFGTTGLHIVVYDNVLGKVIDNICYQTYDMKLTHGPI